MGIGKPGRWIFACFLVVVASFFAVGAFHEYSTRAVGRAAHEIATDAMPSIEHLAAMQSDARHAQYLLDAWVDSQTGGQPRDRAELEQALEALKAEQRAYLRLPMSAAELDLADALERADDTFLTAVDRAMSEQELGARALAQRTADFQVRPAADRLAGATGRDIDFNALAARNRADVIERTRRHGIASRWLLDGLCAALAVAMALVLWRSLRKSQELREEHAQLLERRAEELESFSGRVAHDILSPLAAVRLSLALLGRGADLRGRELVERGQRAVSRVERLTDDLLGFARAGAAPVPGSRADAVPVIDGVLEELRPLANEAQALLAFAPTASRPQVACAEGILTSLVSNLVKNAVKYLGDAPARRVTVRLVERGARVRVEVSDTGPGVPPDLVERIFLPHVRGRATGQPGLGLGLATVKHLAESHGGQVGLLTRLGEGSTFWFELPRAAPMALADRSPPPGISLQ